MQQHGEVSKRAAYGMARYKAINKGLAALKPPMKALSAYGDQCD